MTVARNVADVLADHVVFEVECIDRMYCNVYVSQLQYAGGLLGFIQRQLGCPIQPVVPVSQLDLSGRGAVMEPPGPVHLLAPPTEQRIVDRDRDRCPGRQQVSHHQPGQHQSHLPWAPPGRGEEPVRPAVLPHPRPCPLR